MAAPKRSAPRFERRDYPWYKWGVPRLYPTTRVIGEPRRLARADLVGVKMRL